MATFQELAEQNPNIRQQYDEWREQRAQNGEDPTDYQAFRQHLIALGAPRQDNWIRAHRDELNVGVAFGVGCGLDLLAGLVPRAPLWMQRAGLEWLHRFRCEPRRLWHRYLVNDTPMFARLVAESVRTARA